MYICPRTAKLVDSLRQCCKDLRSQHTDLLRSFNAEMQNLGLGGIQGCNHPNNVVLEALKLITY